jgi:hypothetical protein
MSYSMTSTKFLWSKANCKYNSESRDEKADSSSLGKELQDSYLLNHRSIMLQYFSLDDQIGKSKVQ